MTDGKYVFSLAVNPVFLGSAKSSLNRGSEGPVCDSLRPLEEMITLGVVRAVLTPKTA